MKGILGVRRRAARLERLHRRPALVDLRRDDDAGHGRPVRQGLRLVRQRVGLLEPHGRARPARRRRSSERWRRHEHPLQGIRIDHGAARSRTSASSSASTSTSRSTDGKITDDSRIREALPTIKHALERGARVVLASHLGRPKKGPDPKSRLEPCARAPRRAARAGGARCPRTASATRRRRSSTTCAAGRSCLLENLRFHPEEEKDDEAFCRAARRARRRLRRRRVRRRAPRPRQRPRARRSCTASAGCGFLLEKEIAALGKLVDAPEKPYVAVLGGAKVSDKIAVVESLLERVDALVIGGAMANTFLAAQGKNMQASLVEDDKLAARADDPREGARPRASRCSCRSTSSSPRAPRRRDGRDRAASTRSPPGTMALDIGPKTVARLRRSASPTAKTMFWNGPMGLFEKAPFASGTFGVARAMADSQRLHGRRRRRQRGGRHAGGRRHRARR